MSQGSNYYANSSILTDFTSTDTGTKSMRVGGKPKRQNKQTIKMQLTGIEEELMYLRSKTNSLDWKLWVLFILTVLIVGIC